MLSGLRNRFRRRSSQQSLEGGPPIAADRQVVVSGLMSKAITGGRDRVGRLRSGRVGGHIPGRWQ